MITFNRIVTRLDPYVFSREKKMYRFLNDKKFFAINVTKL